MGETNPTSEERELPEELLNLRNQIDAIDHRMLDLLGQRKEVVAQVADVKRKNIIAIRDRKREAEILADRRELCLRLGLSNEVIESLYRVI